VENTVAPGLLILATRTGFTRAEIISLSLRRFLTTIQFFLKRD